MNPRADAPTALDGFKLKAVVDWIRFEVRLQHPSQFRHLQDRTRQTWGKIHFREVPDSQARAWIFTIQNPSGPEKFMRDVQAMRNEDEPPIEAHQITIRGIEIALDAYLPNSDKQELAAAVLHLIRHQAHPPKGGVRITWPGRADAEFSLRDALKALRDESATIRIGAKGADHTNRAYVKHYDTIGEVAYEPLPRFQWRARFECTLQGDSLPFTSIDAWHNFRFESLSKNHFALIRPTPKSQLMAAMQDHKIQLGSNPDRPNTRRISAPGTKRDSVTNDRIRMALRKLDRCHFGSDRAEIRAEIYQLN